MSMHTYHVLVQHACRHTYRYMFASHYHEHMHECMMHAPQIKTPNLIIHNNMIRGHPGPSRASFTIFTYLPAVVREFGELVLLMQHTNRIVKR